MKKALDGVKVIESPLFGQDSRYIFGELLGMSEKGIGQLEEEEVIY